jgi:signal transduction histidine kinase
VFSPLKDLSQKMVDFLNQKYTYQFSVPESNEVGDLQGTFNAMAQRVLTNMEELKSLDQAKSEFLSIASHELRTPLTSIKGSLSLLRSGIVGQMNEAAENLMNIALTETDRLIRLINDLLDLAKIEARKFPLSLNWTSLSSLVDSTFLSLQGLTRTAGVELVADSLPPVEVYMDSDRIKQVLTNLLSNAVKFSPKGSHISLTSYTDDKGLLWIEITDQGKGIAPEDQELIFQKFRQATSPQNPLVKGTGLGLAIAKGLIEEHGGEIGVRSTVGHGATFFFSLPKWKFTKAEAKTSAEPERLAA